MNSLLNLLVSIPIHATTRNQAVLCVRCRRSCTPPRPALPPHGHRSQFGYATDCSRESDKKFDASSTESSEGDKNPAEHVAKGAGKAVAEDDPLGRNRLLKLFEIIKNDPATTDKSIDGRLLELLNPMN